MLAKALDETENDHVEVCAVKEYELPVAPGTAAAISEAGSHAAEMLDRIWRPW